MHGIFTDLVDFYGKSIGKYTSPVDSIGMVSYGFQINS